MKMGKALVELLSDLTDRVPDWVVFPDAKNRKAEFATATFDGLSSETIGALMPLSIADEPDGIFTIQVNSIDIKITVFCHIEDAPASAREYPNG